MDILRERVDEDSLNQIFKARLPLPEFEVQEFQKMVVAFISKKDKEKNQIEVSP